MSCNLQGICSWKRARCFPPLTSPCASSKSDQWPPKGFLIWSSSSAIATPWCFASVLGSHGCWPWSQDYMVWPIFWNIALRLYEKQIVTWSWVSTGYIVLFLFQICINICAHPTIMMPARGTQTWRSMCMRRKLTWRLTPPTPQPKTWRSMCMWRKLTWTLIHPTPPTQDVT